MIALALVGCDPYAGWPDPHDVYPYVYTEETDLPDYVWARVETETWFPLEDLVETGLYIQKALYHRPSAPFETVVHFGEIRPTIPPVVLSDPTFSFVGDVMRFHGGWATFADDVADRLDGDVRIGNLETPVSQLHPTDTTELAEAYGIYAFNSPVELLGGLPLDVVQLNNNHSLDLGDQGLDQTLLEVTAAGLTPIGVDNNLVVVEGDALAVALLSYTWGLNVQDPTVHDLHVVPFGHLDEPVDLAPVGDQIRAIREAGATHVVLLLHWGFEYEYYPDPHFLQLGRELVALGADLVVGSGPHAVEPAEICSVNRAVAIPDVGRCSVRTADGVPRTAAILYSLGNFGTAMETVPLQVGLVATVSLRTGVGVTGLGWEAVASVDAPGSGQRLVPLDDRVEDPVYGAEAARLDVLLGTSWKRTR